MKVSVITRRFALVALLGIAVMAGGAGHAAQTAIPAGTSIAFVDAGFNSGTIVVPNGEFTNNSVDTVKVTVVLDSNFPEDIDLLLVGPGGAPGKAILMSDAGGPNGNAITPDTVTFDDTAANSVSTVSQLTTGTYKPTDVVGVCDQGDTDAFTGAPSGTYVANLDTAFDGKPASGTWTLYAIDDCSLANVGGVISSWTLQITPKVTTGVVLKTFTGARLARGVELRWRTANEADALGFNVYRVAGKKNVKLNRTLLAAKQSGTARGAAYKLLDRQALKTRAYTYRLQVVSLSGKRTWAAKTPVRAAK